MQRTLRLKLTVNPDDREALLRTAQQHTACYNAITAEGWETHTTNGVALHHATYFPLRERFPDQPSQLVCTARVQAVESLRSVRALLKQGRRIAKPVSVLQAVRYDHRTYTISLVKGWATLASVAGRVRVGFSAGFSRLRDWKPTAAHLVFRKGRVYLHVTVEKPAPEVVPNGEVVGVDLGITRPAVTSEAQFLGERRWRNVSARYFRHRRSLQAKATRSARRRLRKVSGHEARFRRDCDHVISRRLVDSIEPGTTIVFENLKGIRDTAKARGAKGRRRLHSWSFDQGLTFSSYKAEEKGVLVTTVDPRKSSQRCSRCGYVSRSNRRSQSEFSCRKCDFTLNADLNAGRNHKAKYLARGAKSVSGGPSVNRPIVAGVVA